ncbi:adenosine deaminase [Actinomyces procaprae]|uniref:adenosine deaminase n=1 Tax=Actinomyces procaprae TaxID=2560010 RepID=UPI0010A29A54|nr:adenosine deaminase [Actinomyces procaprae]
MRDLSTLPKAHLHLHFTGSMRLETLVELASSAHARLPSSFLEGDPLHVPADHRGWFRFQRAYDTARHLVVTEEVMRRIVLEAALDDAAEGSRRLEIQVDPTSYAPFVGGITPALEIILDAARQASILSGVEVAVIVAASRMRHPLEARTLARLAAHYAGDEPGTVVGFGLSNDERAGETASWGPAFAIARRAGLASLPHGGELLGPEHVRDVVSALGPTRLGHGIRTSEDPALLDAVAAAGISLEVCPASNVCLGVYREPGDVPLPTLLEHGAQVALGADDPLLFQSRLVDQYQIARDQGLDDAALAELARGSIRASLASPSSKREWLAQVDAWLAADD